VPVRDAVLGFAATS
jgi:hypothetical protein